MTDASRLVRAMQKVATPKENDVVDMVIGTVTSVSPLRIKTDKITLSETFLIVGALCKSKYVGDTLLWRGLQVGDSVYMIRFSKGQKYFELWR